MRERKATKIFKRKGTKLNTDNYQDFTNVPLRHTLIYIF